MGICNKTETRKFYKTKLAESNSSIPRWSSEIWQNLNIKAYGPKVVGSYIPLKYEPIVPISPDFIYPKLISETEMIYEKEPDLILIPGLCFSENGFRLGRGGGYFDRYISKHPNVYRIALAFEMQVAEQPSWQPDPWDQKVDEIITEKRRIKHGN